MNSRCSISGASDATGVTETFTGFVPAANPQGA